MFNYIIKDIHGCRWYGAVVVGGIILCLSLGGAPASAQQAVLENPPRNSFQSGIGVISGWVCEAAQVDIVIDDHGSLQAPYGTSREDTGSVCGDTNNGFGLLFNWSLLGDGVHTVRALADGVEFAKATVSVITLGTEFLRDVEREASLTGFPSARDSLSLQWEQSIQNFVIRGTNGASGGNAGVPPKILENPQPGAFVSGIGTISGWVCDASKIEIEFDNDTPNKVQAGYGVPRRDMAGICGDTDNGFGLLYNWNNLGDGLHTVRALADGVEFARVTVAVKTFGEEFLTDVRGSLTISDFPQPGVNVDLLWQESQQNFVISGVSGSGSEGVRAGLDALKVGNVREANHAFRQAAMNDPADATAGLYHAVTRIATKAIDSPQLRGLARRSGLSLGGDASNVCLAAFPPPRLPEEIPSGAPQTAEILGALRNVLVPEIDAALTTLNGLPVSLQAPFVLGDLPHCLSVIVDDFVVEIDRSDVQVLTAALQAVRGGLEILAAYDTDVDLQVLTTLTLQNILAVEPATFPLVSRARLSSAQTFFDHALANASQAISSVLAETDSQADDVLVITPGDVAEAQTIKQVLDLVRQSLRGTVVLPAGIGLNDPERLNLSVFFSGRIRALRPLLLAPRGVFSDSTFGGIAPDFTQQDIERYVPENFLVWLVGE